MDIFALAHFLGWLIKATLLRHHIIAWTLSINWEITEVSSLMIDIFLFLNMLVYRGTIE